MQIVKRDGREIGFQKGKIVEAIVKSMNETKKGIDVDLANKISESISKINKENLSVEDIQDLVEQKLMKSNRKDVAKQYISYRSERTRMREINNEINTKIKKIVACSDVQNANANVDEHSFGGRKFESAGVIHKKIGLEMMRPETALAHKENRVYQHDLDSYDIGMHNCLFLDMERVLNNGFETRNGDVRPASSYSTACQLVAVAFQVQSQVQFGGCGSAHIDYDLKPFVKKSFIKHFKDGLKYIDELEQYEIDNIIETNDVQLSNLELEQNFKKSFKYALEKTDKEGLQASQGLYHNLNTLESRAGSQVPFTSINFGRDKTPEGRKVTEWMLKSSIDGIGKNHRTSIFPISIFQYKKGENDKVGTPNYDLKKLAIKSLTKRIYPNIVNCDYTQNIEDINSPDTSMATMGCVDGEEIITYKYKDLLFIESFKRMWDRLSKDFEVKEQQLNNNFYIDLNNVLIYDTNKGFVDTKRIIKNQDKGDWNRVKFSNGRSLLATSDHPLPIEKKGRVFVKDLIVGDKIQINQNQYSETNIEYSQDKAWLLGFLLCDGCYDMQLSSSIALTGEDDIEENYRRIFKEIYDLNVETVVWNRGARGDYKELKVRTGNYKAVELELLEVFGGKQKIYRQIPNEVFSWNRESKLSFLAGMIDADGYINSTGHSGTIVQIGSTNKELALQTAALSQSLGIPTKTYLNHYTSKDKSKIRYRVEFSATIELLNYMACNKKIDCFTREANTTKTNVAVVVSVEMLGNLNKYSYDVTTESDFFEVSGICNHNCRTMIGADRHGLGYSKIGRGNVAPVTMDLPKIGIKHGICLGERTEADLEGFWKEFDEVLGIASQSLVDRFYHICSQNYRSAPFMYTNGTIADFDKVIDKGIYEAMRHGTLAMGYIGIAEMCQALFGKNHAEDKEVHKFALSVVKYISEYTKKVSEVYNLNFSCYASPAENTCKTMMQGLQKEFGMIENVTSRAYLTNSHHIPVWQKVSIFEKLNLEAPFCRYPTGGCITYVELDSAIIKNEKAIEDIIDYAMSLDIPYLAFNFPIDTCLDCGYQGEFNDKCLVCGSANIQQLRRVTGYLTTDYKNFNAGKIAEVEDRIKHSKYTDFGE